MVKRIINALKDWPVVQLVILAIYIIWVIIYFSWGMNYVYLGLVKNPTEENQQLAAEIEGARQELEGMPDTVTELTARMAAAQEQLEDERSRIPAAININDLVRNIVEIADARNVSVIPLTTSAPEYSVNDQFSYGFWNINISVAGDFEDIAGFLADIDGGNIASGTATSFSMTAGDAASDNGTSASPATGKVNLTVYTR